MNQPIEREMSENIIQEQRPIQQPIEPEQQPYQELI